MSAKNAIIMRGIPGSGKSTMAHFLASLNGTLEGELQFDTFYYWSENETFAAIHSTDQRFVDDSGVYRFNPSKLGAYHNANYKAFRESIDHNIPLVIVDNTNTTHKEWIKYQQYAEQAGYYVSFLVMPHPTPTEAVKRNTHGVPLEAIRRMIQRFE